MTWHTKELKPGDLLIMDGNRVVGSIVSNTAAQRAGRWRVEILWSSNGGDITFDSDEYTSALAFVSGVEAAFARTLR